MFRKAQSETGCDQHVQWFLAWLPQKLPFTALLIFYFLPIFSQAFFLNSPSHAQTVTYTYDEATSTNGIGRLTSVSDTASGTTKLYYDSMGRINKTDRVIDTVTYTTQTGYDLAGRTKSVTYPDNDVVNYSYNGPLLQKVYKDASTTYVEYPVNTSNALGQPGTATFGNGVTTTYTYSNTSNVDCPQQNFRLCKVTTIKTASTFQSIKYSYDTVGNISAITDALPTGGPHTNQTQTFGYDLLNRLTSANGPYGAITYHYDKNGNMLCNSALGSTPTCDPTLQNYASNYTYGDPAHAHAVTSAAGVNYTYDANGNMTGRGTHVLAYDLESRLSSVTIGSTTTSFVYDGNGARVKKISGSTFIYIGKLFECVSPCKPSGVWTGTKHIFAGAVRIASKPITTTGEISYYHPDHLGSTSVVTDKNGANTAEFVYYPFGDPYIDNAGVHYKYTGQERDNETALYFYNARYYDSRIGRFISPDSIVQSRSNPQFLNRYSYVVNNPMKLIDPSGQVTTCSGSGCGWYGIPSLLNCTYTCSPKKSTPAPPVVTNNSASFYNACANYNCAPVPPPGSGGGNAGNSCPVGGCSGLWGSITNLTNTSATHGMIVGNGNIQASVSANTPGGVKEKTVSVTLGGSAGAGKGVTGGISVNFGWDETQGWVSSAFSFSVTATGGGGAYAGVGASVFLGVGSTNAPSVSGLNGQTNVVGTNFNTGTPFPLLPGSTTSFGADVISNGSGTVTGSQYSIGGSWGPHQPVNPEAYVTWSHPIYQTGYQTGSPANTGPDYVTGGSNYGSGYNSQDDIFDYGGGGW
ncbi:MAG: hypothetical protein MCM46_14800 [Candidatus Manganitrophus sp. SB1]|nr:hypothetical protein [Candidatus Manganitrophus morganii]